MAKKYLDYDGLQKVINKIKNLFAPKNRGVEYIRGTWTATSGTWTGKSNDTELYDGKQIILYMPYGGSGNATLNLTLADGTTTGAKNVYYESTTRFTTNKEQNSQLHLIYHTALTLSNGNTYEGWWYVANRDTNDYAVHIGFNHGLWKTKTALYRYQLLFTMDETTLVPANAVNNSTATTKTLTTESFDPTGQIFYYNSSTTVNANAAIGASIRTQHSLIDLRYSFNTGSTLTANEAIYLVCEPQSDGKVKLAASPIIQSLPSTDDGKIYKLLGRAYDNYRIYLYQDKPCYWYKNGGVQLYVRDAATVNGHTVNTNVPANAKFTDTVTTATTSGNGNAVTAISASNGALTVTKGTTFLTSHQDISGKADKSATVSTVAWDSTNKKLTKTINGSTSDVVTGATILDGLTESQVTTALGYTPAIDENVFHLFRGTNLYGETDLNNVTEIGSYFSGSSTTTNALSHCPISNAGFTMHVDSMTGNDTDYIRQRIYFKNEEYVRTKAGSSASWSNWFKTLVQQGPLPNGTNLNELNTEGIWFLNGDYTYTNAPATYGLLEVLRPHTSGVTLQRITTTKAIYYRYQAGTSWYSWKTVPTKNQVDEKTQVKSTTMTMTIGQSTDYTTYTASLPTINGTPISATTDSTMVVGISLNASQKKVSVICDKSNAAVTGSATITIYYI